MGLDLTFLPFDSDNEVICFSQTILNVERFETLNADIYKIRPKIDVPKRFRSFMSRESEFSECHYGITTFDPYGEPIKYVFVDSLLRFSKRLEVTGSAKNRAVWAYLKELSLDTKIALYWH